jgi:hypothetical protein
MNKNRDAIYLWMSLYTFSFLGSFFSGMLLLSGGDNSHLSYYLQGSVEGNLFIKTSFEDLKYLFLIFWGMSFIMQFLFAKERAKILPSFFLDQLFLLSLWGAFTFVISSVILTATPLEIKDETFRFKEVIILSTAWISYVIYIFFLIMLSFRKLLPVAKKLDNKMFN